MEIVQSDLRETCFGHALSKQFGELVGVDWTADLVGEHVTLTGVPKRAHR